jgi:ribose 5-phosphate isomerase B
MRIAVTSDEPYAVHADVVAWLEQHGHDVVRFGSFVEGSEVPYVGAAEAAARAVASGDCAMGVFACWTGTGVSIAANKVAGVRAALCGDAQTAAGARVWNDANVLCLSNRSLSRDVAREVLAAWFTSGPDATSAAAVADLVGLDARTRCYTPGPGEP